ncbi:hypothetical protein SUGI_0019360 [Cryptomeria japonica]|uniref:jacalin-related lectin 19 n=1 Tax=Cryptomeria japonica TaxID=3369 RepID=UPI002408AF4D|nr:jacalin-related lectin 19 [Cryptomeria japonica]GLJ05512.1 hypothetical protein SUGI_0019360 [Cryptomeria japonica]
MSTKHKSLISSGPWGGPGGAPWDDKAYSGVKQIVIVSGACIDSVRFEYSKKGRSVWSEKHGGNGGDSTYQVVLDYPNEYLTAISGHHGSISHGSPSVIRSLTFQTNRKKYGPYGVSQGTYFSFPTNGAKVKGFHGKSGWYLDSIGVHCAPASQNTIWSTIKGSAKSILKA